MISKTRGIFSGNLWKPKNIHSVEYLKYLYTILNKNQNITEQNKDLLVEVFRLIAEILIWGDQNDSSVIDFFLEKNILSIFLKFMNHKNGKLICNQLLQTLSIMFENISDNTSIYYLLSNNHINNIICHKFDFTDEEVMAYYISFLKALSMKLNKHTINFFYNEHTDDFALYTESIKFFDETEPMVRTAVRVITLNVYKIADKPMLQYIRGKTADPYFRNLVWCIGNNVIEVDKCIKNESDPSMASRLQSLIDEHLDQLHYINDILCLNVDILNDILVDCMLNRLLIPLYVYSLTKHRPYSPDTDNRPHVTSTLAVFLIAQVFIIIKHPKIVHPLAEVILTGDLSSCITVESSSLSLTNNKESFLQSNNVDSIEQTCVTVRERKFQAPSEKLSATLDNIKGCPRPRSKELKSKTVEDCSDEPNQKNQSIKSNVFSNDNQSSTYSAPVTPRHRYNSNSVITENVHSAKPDDPYLVTQLNSFKGTEQSFNLEGKPFLKTIFRSLTFDDDNKTTTNDYSTLFTMCLLFAICQNQGVGEKLLSRCGFTSKSKMKDGYNRILMEKIISIFNNSVKYGSSVRLVTIELACILVEILVCSRNHCFMSDEHFAYILTAREESTLLLRNYYKSEDVFVDMFEDEYIHLQKKPLNVEFLMMDSKILLPLSTEHANDIDFTRRLPVTDIERTRYTIKVFLLLRQLCDKLKIDDATDDVDDVSMLSCVFDSNIVSVGDKLDLKNRDLIGCSIDRNGRSERKFLVIDEQQIILVEPDTKKVGWGVVTFVGFLQHLSISPIKEDNRSLYVVVYNHSGSIALKTSQKETRPILSEKFMFDDHIRCMVANKRLDKGRELAQQRKLQQIAIMLDFPTNVALGVKPTSSNSNREYRTGYFGPNDNSFGADRQRNTSQSTTSSSLIVRKVNSDNDDSVFRGVGGLSSSELSVDKNHFG